MQASDHVHIERLGAGPDLVLLHGWGLNGGIWQGVKQQLAESFKLHIVDLPGYGNSAPLLDGDKADTPIDTHQLAAHLAQHLPSDAIWLGWSFGGCVATAAAHNPQIAVRKIITVASNPKFTLDEDWPTAMKPEVLSSFAKQLNKNYLSTIKRFLAIQSLGAADQKKQIQMLLGWLMDRPEPDTATLHRDLGLLHSTDLRQELAQLTIPHLSILGKNDALVPKTLAQALPKLRPNITCELFSTASHAPFVSDPKRFIECVRHFAL